jgi:hypothetical protein
MRAKRITKSKKLNKWRQYYAARATGKTHTLQYQLPSRLRELVTVP